MTARDQQLALNSACRRLLALRSGAIIVLIGLVLWVHFVMAIHLPLLAVAAAILVLVGLNVGVYWRLHSGREPAPGMVFAQLLVDVAVLTALLYCTGGSDNPFVSFYLLPLVVSAVVLSRVHAALMAVLTMACYSALMFWHVALPVPLQQFQLHILGMWCSFILSAGLIAFFVAHMAAALRRRERELAQAREQALRNEHIVALGTLAAGAAHELATPLSTMAVITHEMQTADDVDAERAAELNCLSEQIATCKATLARLRDYGGETTHARAPADAWLRRIADDWRLLRPETLLQWQWNGARPAVRVRCDDGFARTLMNLLNNAADASPDWVALSAYVGTRDLIIDVCDAGAGVAADIRMRAHNPGATTKANGHGLGLLLASATVARLGGRVHWLDREHGGIRTRVVLPLQTLEAE